MGDSKICIQVTLFSKFEIRYNELLLDANCIRSEKLLKLLVFVLYHRKTQISNNQFYDVLWNEGNETGSGALKNLFYRLRGVLFTEFDRKDFIISSRGSYAWNQSIEVDLDSEQFLSYIQEAQQQQLPLAKISAYEKAFELYTGDFLPMYCDELWILQISTYYHSLYISCVKNLAMLYETQEAYERMEHICNIAIKMEELDEGIHCLIIKSLIKQNKKTLAMEHYKRVKSQLYSQLGISPSTDLKALYQQLLKDMKSEEKDLHLIQESMMKQENEQGAFYCDYGVFKEVYVIQSRQAKRLGIAVHCALLSISSKKAFPQDSKMYQKFEDIMMEMLKLVILDTLRSGDVFARFSATQYMLLLPTCDFEGGLVALKRIEDKFYEKVDPNSVGLLSDLKEMDIA